MMIDIPSMAALFAGGFLVGYAVCRVVSGQRYQRLEEENITLRHNIININSFDDARAAEEALAFDPVPEIRQRSAE